MFKSRLHEILGGESEDIVVEVSPEQFVEQQQNEAIAEAEADIAEAQEDIAQNESDIETLEERVEDLEEAVEGLESMINGRRSWNPELAQELYNRARKIDVRTFGEDRAVSFKGAECFSDKDTAMYEVLSGLESFKDKAKKMWEGIKNFFINLYKSIIAFFVGLFNRFKGLEKKADALKSRIANMDEEKIKKEIKLGSWNAFVNIENRHGDDGKALRKLSSTITSACKTIGSSLVGDDAEKTVKQIADSLDSIVKEGEKKHTKDSNDNTITYEIKVGAVNVTITMPKDNAKDKVTALKETKVSYTVGKEGAKLDGTLTDKSGNKTSMTFWCDKMREAAQEAQLAQFDQKALSNSRDKAVAKAEIAVRNTGEDNKETARKNVQIIMQSHAAAMRISRTLLNFDGDMIKAGLAYVSAHL